jgi:hypothetical protein
VRPRATREGTERSAAAKQCALACAASKGGRNKGSGACSTNHIHRHACIRQRTQGRHVCKATTARAGEKETYSAAGEMARDATCISV